MNTKTFKLFTLTLISASLVLFGHGMKAFAGDQVLVETVVVTDDWVAAKQNLDCGKSEDTSNSCQDAFRACNAGIDEIMDRAYRECGRRPDECNIIDVTATGFTRQSYNLLVADPIDFYSNSAEVAVLKNCRTQHPKSEDSQVQAAPSTQQRPGTVGEAQAEERKRQEELGEIEPRQAKADVGTEALGDDKVSADAVPAAAAPAAAVPAAEQDKAVNAGGCSMQAAGSSALGWESLALLVMMFIPLATTLCVRSMGLSGAKR